jgi:hypothetical protein
VPLAGAQLAVPPDILDSSGAAASIAEKFEDECAHVRADYQVSAAECN